MPQSVIGAQTQIRQNPGRIRQTRASGAPSVGRCFRRRLAFGLDQPRAGFGGFALAVPHAGIGAPLRQQPRMGSALDDAAMIQKEDFVGVDHG